MSTPRPRGQTITVSQAAALLGRSDRWVQGLVKAGYIERANRGEYTLVAVIRGALAYYEDQITKNNKAAAATRASEARTREIELRIQERSRELIAMEDARAVIGEMAALARDGHPQFAHGGEIRQAHFAWLMGLPKDHFLLRAMFGVPSPYAPFQGTPDARAELGMEAQNLLVNGNRPDARRGLQYRHHHRVKDVGQWIRPAPPARLLLLGRQGWIGLQPIARGPADAGFGGGHGGRMGLSERHEEPRLMVSDMTARHERSPACGGTISIRADHDRQTRPLGAKRGGGISPVGLCPPYETPPPRSHLD